MTLQQKLFLAFSFIVIIPITLLGMIVIELIITRSDESIASIVRHELAMAQAHYQQRGKIVERGIQQAANIFGPQQTILHFFQAEHSPRQAGVAPGAIEKLLAHWHHVHPGIDLWLVVDNQGDLSGQFSTEASFLWPTRIAPPFKDLLNTTLATGQATITSELLTWPGISDQYLVQLVMVPVGPPDNPAGAVMAIDRLDNNIWPLPPQTGLSYGAADEQAATLAPFIFITHREEIIATSPTDLSHVQILTADVQEAIQITVGANWNFNGQSTIGSKAYQLAGAPIFDSRRQIIGGFFVGLPYRKYFGLQAQTSWIVTTMLILSGVISLITASLIASAITQPIQTLIEKSGSLAGGDLSVRASVYGKDEIGQLGHAFNKMAANLETSYEALERERQRALAIIEASADGIWVVNKQADGERRVTIVNSALERMTGRNRRELVGQKCHGLMGVCTLERKSLCAVSCPFVHPRQESYIMHGLLPGADGDETPVEISYGYLTNQLGELTGLVHIMRDLTLRREVERLKADFISMVSHELRTPLTHIKGFASSLLQTDVTWDSETEHDFLESIDREADRLTKLVENLLQMSRIEAGGLKDMERHPHSVDELLDLALPELHRRANQHHLMITMTPGTANREISANARRIELVLANLVENAAKYSPPHTPILLAIENEDNQVIFNVQDEGPGIDISEQVRIFDRFYRVKDTRRRAGGTGLGLAICKQLVTAHGGEIWVTNCPHQGACFSFSLPAVLNPADSI